MPRIDAKTKAGPPGRPRLSFALMQRKGLMDPRQRRSANLLATNKRTARGVGGLSIDYTGVPTGVQTEMVKIVAKIEEIVANLVERSLMENLP